AGNPWLSCRCAMVAAKSCASSWVRSAVDRDWVRSPALAGTLSRSNSKPRPSPEDASLTISDTPHTPLTDRASAVATVIVPHSRATSTPRCAPDEAPHPVAGQRAPGAFPAIALTLRPAAVKSLRAPRARDRLNWRLRPAGAAELKAREVDGGIWRKLWRPAASTTPPRGAHHPVPGRKKVKKKSAPSAMMEAKLFRHGPRRAINVPDPPP